MCDTSTTYIGFNLGFELAIFKALRFWNGVCSSFRRNINSCIDYCTRIVSFLRLFKYSRKINNFGRCSMSFVAEKYPRNP